MVEYRYAQMTITGAYKKGCITLQDDRERCVIQFCGHGQKRLTVHTHIQ